MNTTDTTRSSPHSIKNSVENNFHQTLGNKHSSRFNSTWFWQLIKWSTFYIRNEKHQGTEAMIRVGGSGGWFCGNLCFVVVESLLKYERWFFWEYCWLATEQPKYRQSQTSASWGKRLFTKELARDNHLLDWFVHWSFKACQNLHIINQYFTSDSDYPYT